MTDVTLWRATAITTSRSDAHPVWRGRWHDTRHAAEQQARQWLEHDREFELVCVEQLTGRPTCAAVLDHPGNGAP